MSELRLQPLARADARLVLDAALGRERRTAALPTATAEAILDRADGNPFFIQELARAMGPAAEAVTAVPESVEAVLLARIDRLPDEAKGVLQAASVLGRDVPVGLLEAITAEVTTPRERLRELQQLEYLHDRSEGSSSCTGSSTRSHGGCVFEPAGRASPGAPRSRRGCHRGAVRRPAGEQPRSWPITPCAGSSGSGPRRTCGKRGLRRPSARRITRRSLVSSRRWRPSAIFPAAGLRSKRSTSTWIWVASSSRSRTTAVASSISPRRRSSRMPVASGDVVVVPLPASA